MLELLLSHFAALNMQLLQVNQPAPGPGQNINMQPASRGAVPAAPIQQQQTALQKLQKEKELLRQRQEELNRQVDTVQQQSF